MLLLVTASVRHARRSSRLENVMYVKTYGTSAKPLKKNTAYRAGGKGRNVARIARALENDCRKIKLMFWERVAFRIFAEETCSSVY